MTTDLRAATPPRARRTAVAVGLLLAVLSLVLQAALMQRGAAGYDEGLILYGAARVARGELPYRDFWSMYGPGSFFVIAGFFQAFGETQAVARGFDMLCRTAIVWLVFALVARVVGGWRAAALAALCALGLLVVAAAYEFPVYPAFALSLLALLCVSRAMATPGRAIGWFAAGLAAGLAATFRHDLGSYALAACAYACWASRALAAQATGLAAGGAGAGLAPALAPGPTGRAPRLGPGIALAVGFVLAFGVPMAALLQHVPLADAFENLVRIPALVYGPNRHLPFPQPLAALREAVALGSVKPLAALAYYAPMGIAIAAALASWRVRRGARRAAPAGAVSAQQIGFETAALLTALFCLKAWVRIGSIHVMPALVLAVVPGAILAVRSGSRAWQALAVAAVVAVVGVRLVAASPSAGAEGVAAPTQGAATASALSRWVGCEPTRIARLRCFHIDPARAAVLDFLDRHAVPDVPIYVGAGRHDKLFVNDVELYFFSGLPAPTRWHDLHPGVQTTLAVQTEMVAALRARPPQFVVVNTRWDDYVEPNDSARSSGVTLLDDYLRAHYEPVFRSGSFTVSKPRGAVPEGAR